MAVTFGTRSAMRDLAEELAPGERVLELAACTYAGAAGLIALTTGRVIAIRDDYSKHQVQFVVVAEVATIDYDPAVHDGFALFTATGRLVVRKMRREDGDRLVDALLTRGPHIQVKVTRPVGAPVSQPAPQLGSQLGRLGRHRKPAAPGPVRPAAASTPVGPLVTAQADAAQSVARAAGAPPPAPASAPATSSSSSSSGGDTPTGTRAATDKEILLGVLADLHAQGVLTAAEFAAKVRQIVAQP